MTKREAEREARAKLRAKADTALFKRRTAGMFRSLGARGGLLAFGLEELRALVRATAECPYCREKLTTKTFSVDHRTPLARGGGNTIWNLSVCCAAENRAKGSLTGDEYQQLVTAMREWPREARNDVLGRLKAGGAVRRLRFLKR